MGSYEHTSRELLQLSVIRSAYAGDTDAVEVPVRMTNFARILNELNSSFSGRNDIVDRLCRYPLLIIDDFGMERGTEYALEQIYNIVDSRYRSRKPLMHVVKQSEFPVYVGQHEAIVSEDDWNLAQTKRQRTTGRREKVRDPDHAHILSGILKCPCCGRNLYGNVSKAHSKDNKTRYYYFCKSIKGQTGHECSFRLNIEQNEINQMVASIVSAMVHDPRFVDAIKEKIGSAVDTSELEQQADAIKAQLRQRLSTKSRLEHQMDTLDFNDPYYDRKALDLQRRYDEQYELIEDMETQLTEIQGQVDDIHQEKITADNIYHLLLAFDEVYNAATEVEQKEFMRAFIEHIDIFPEKQPDGNWIRNIVFAFPVPYNGKEIREFPLESQSTVEAVLLLTKLHVERHIEVDVSMDELDVTAAESKATYDQIRDYVWEHHQLKVSNLYIAQVKQKYGVIERENYHKAKSENTKQPKCPKDKEDAIVEALKYFKII